jgi:hypothetical protein
VNKAPAPVTLPVLFQCITGPDKGKRVALTDRDIVLGGRPECNIRVMIPTSPTSMRS